jgi:PAS domain S-box-containing protein
VRVLIVDDQEFIRRGIRAVLSDTDDIEVCGEAVDGHEAILRTRQLMPDVVIMDISMPILDGIEATREIRRMFPKVRVLTLSQYDLPDVAREAVQAGAATHVSKVYVWTQLVPALRRVHMGERFFDGNFAATAEELERMRRSRLELEEALRESEERFRRTFDVTSSGVWHVHEDGRMLRVNQRLCEMLRFSREEIQKLRVQDITHPADLGADLAQTQRVIAGEIDHFAVERRLVRKDGQVVGVNLTVHAVRDAQGKLKYCIRVADDARDRRDAEEKLAQAQRDLQLATAHLDLVAGRLALALTRCTHDLRYVWVNQNYADLLERPLEKIVGHAVLDVLGAEAFQKLQQHFERVLAGEKVLYEERLTLATIGARDISAVYIPTFNAAGVLDGWMGMVQDVTARNQASRLAQHP